MKQALKQYALGASRKARQRRAELFKRLFAPTEDNRILDLGGGDGSHIASIVPFRQNVWVADILPRNLEKAKEKYGFNTVLVKEDEPLPFPDQYFDIVFCSSVIEHVTIPKAEIYTCTSEREFVKRALESQRRFASEIRRLGKRYYVQTPHRYFLIETHTWLPLPFGLMPRPLLLRLTPFLNQYWIKTFEPDWHLLTPRQMRELFPDAKILIERWYGLPKSIIAYKA